MKVERWEEETDEEWAERLAEEIAIANNTETSKYFVERDSYTEDGVIINYVGEDSWTWKEHPESPFRASQIIEWKAKAKKWDELMPAMKVLADNADGIIETIQSFDTTAREKHE